MRTQILLQAYASHTAAAATTLLTKKKPTDISRIAASRPFSFRMQHSRQPMVAPILIIGVLLGAGFMIGLGLLTDRRGVHIANELDNTKSKIEVSSAAMIVEKAVAYEELSRALEVQLATERTKEDYWIKTPYPSSGAASAASHADIQIKNAEEMLARGQNELKQGSFATATQFIREAVTGFAAANSAYEEAIAGGNEPERIVSARAVIDVFGDDKEAGVVVLRMFQNGAGTVIAEFGDGENWIDPSTRTFDIGNLSIPIGPKPVSIEAALEERPGQINIEAGLNFNVELRTNRRQSLRFSGRHYYRTGERDTRYRLSSN